MADSTPSNSIIVKQQLSRGKQFLCYCFRSNIPHWEYEAINPYLGELGLAQNILNEEIDTINDKAVEYFNNHTRGNCFKYLGSIGFLLTAILIIFTYIYYYHMPVIQLLFIIFLCITVSLCSCFTIKTIENRKWHCCLQEMEVYINNEINEKYMDMNIIWNTDKISCESNYDEEFIESINIEISPQYQPQSVVYVHSDGI